MLLRKFLLAGLLATTLAACQCGTPPPETGDDAGNSGVDGGDVDAGLLPDGGGGDVDAGTDGGSTRPKANPDDPNNPNKDTDCDGVSDAIEYSRTYADGRKTDPDLADSDGDYISDGVELGYVTSVDPTCTNYVGDADPATRTSPTSADTDADGIPDGIEDADGNGRIDSGETDPRNADTDNDGLTDGAEDVNRSGTVDPGESDPRLRDTDGDGISDGAEVKTTRTDPTKADTDSDGCTDPEEDTNRNGIVDPGETNPLVADCSASNLVDTDMDGIADAIEDQYGTNKNLADSDGDGLNDGIEDKNKNGRVDVGETDPRKRDSDCDGLLDGPALGGSYAEDVNANGVVDMGETDPTNPDSDGDGIVDGIERGVSLSEYGTLGVTGCPAFPGDQDDSTTTNPLLNDSDGDGIPDGAEDTNQNGKIDPGELNPNLQTDGQDATVSQVCPESKLRQVAFALENDADLKLALPATFTDVKTLTVNTVKTGLIGYDTTNKVGFIAYKRAAPIRNGSTTVAAANPIEVEAAVRTGDSGNNVTSRGALPIASTKTFTTWDGFPAVLGEYEQTTSADLKTHLNNLATTLVGRGSAVAGLLTGTAGITGAFQVQAEYAYRSQNSVVVVLAITPKTGAPAGSVFSMADTAGGSALAQFADTTAVQCEVFQPGNPLVDFLFVVDDSCSMGGYQTSLAGTASATRTALANSSLDWRIAVITNQYMVTYSTMTSAGSCSQNSQCTGGRTCIGGQCRYGAEDRPNGAVIRGFTTNINQFEGWLTEPSQCNSSVCSGFSYTGTAPSCPGSGTTSNASWGDYGGCWVGEQSYGAEGLLGAARKAVYDMRPAGPASADKKFRSSAQPIVVLLGDADDQTSGWDTNVSNCGGNAAGANATSCEATNNFVQYFASTGTTQSTKNPLDLQIPVHGIICPEGVQCGSEFWPVPQRHGTVIDSAGGVKGDIRSAASITDTMTKIINDSIAKAGYKLLKPPIGASIKVAMNAVLTPASCNKDDIPRSRVNGFDFDGVAGTLSFFGACRPTAGTTKAAVSYRYWVDANTPPDGAPLPCSEDPFFDENTGQCERNLLCNGATDRCECPSGCGTSSPNPNYVCDTNPAVCDWVCTAGCNGTCSVYETCNTGSCECQCASPQNVTCGSGYKFSTTPGACGCVCDTAQLSCDQYSQADAASCSCVCKPDCGGCPTGSTCDPSACYCRPDIG